MEKLAVIIPSRGLTSKQEYMRQWRANNQARIKASRKSYYQANREKEISKATEWTKTHREEDRAKSSKYRAKDGYRSYRNDYLMVWRARQKSDSVYRIKSTLRARLRSAIVNSFRSGSAIQDLGCTIDEFRTYMESRFESGMTWDNWGIYGWHIDHIKPLATFDLTDLEQFKIAVHYTNLQPLWAEENLRKGSRG